MRRRSARRAPVAILMPCLPSGCRKATRRTIGMPCFGKRKRPSLGSIQLSNALSARKSSKQHVTSASPAAGAAEPTSASRRQDEGEQGGTGYYCDILPAFQFVRHRRG